MHHYKPSYKNTYAALVFFGLFIALIIIFKRYDTPEELNDTLVMSSAPILLLIMTRAMHIKIEGNYFITTFLTYTTRSIHIPDITKIELVRRLASGKLLILHTELEGPIRINAALFEDETISKMLYDLKNKNERVVLEGEYAEIINDKSHSPKGIAEEITKEDKKTTSGIPFAIAGMIVSLLIIPITYVERIYGVYVGHITQWFDSVGPFMFFFFLFYVTTLSYKKSFFMFYS